MSEAENRSETELQKLVEKLKQEAEARGVDPKTLLDPTPLNNSSTPTPADSESQRASLNGYSQTLLGAEESRSLSSSSRKRSYESCAPSNGQHQERHRDVRLVVLYHTFGNEEQALQGSKELLRILQVKGYDVVTMVSDGEVLL
jgi:hypothetical protein